MSYFGEDSNITGNLNVGTLQLIGGAITDSSGSISFGSNNVSTTGNVGIGTDNPTKKLTIHSDFGGYSEFNLRSNLQEMLFGCDTSGDRGYIQSRTIAGVNNQLQLQPNGGNVGIGAASPDALLSLYKQYSTPALDGSVTPDYIEAITFNTTLNTFSSGGVNWNTISEVPGARITYTPKSYVEVGSGSAGYHGLLSLTCGYTDSTAKDNGIHIDSSGNVGIGTNNPQSTLHVNGDFTISTNEIWGVPILKRNIASTDYLSIGWSAHTGSDPLTTINENKILNISRVGNVGIGTNVQRAKLQITDDGLNSYSADPSTGNYSQLKIYSKSNGTNSAPVCLNIGTDYINTCGVIQTVQDFIGIPPLQLQPAGGDIVLCRNTGNVGIGTATPTEKFDISGGALRIVGEATTNIPSATISYAISVGQTAIHSLGKDNLTNGIFNLFSSRGNGSHGSSRLYIDENGNVGIGNSSPTKPLYVSGDGYFQGFNIDVGVDHATGSSNGASFLTCRYNGTQIGDIAQSTTSSVVYNTTSDYRLKENVIEMPSMINKIKQLKPVQFNYLEDKQDSLGFIAHEFKEIFSNNAIVSGSKDNKTMCCKNCNSYQSNCKCVDSECEMKPIYQSLDYGKITPICIKGIQELIKENEEQSKVIDNLLERIEALENF